MYKYVFDHLLEGRKNKAFMNHRAQTLVPAVTKDNGYGTIQIEATRNIGCQMDLESSYLQRGTTLKVGQGDVDFRQIGLCWVRGGIQLLVEEDIKR